jgi:hypothetical protein
MENENLNETVKPALNKTDGSGSLTHIPIFQYNSAVEAHKNTLDLLRIVQDDKKELKVELEAAYKEIDRLRGIINYR